jgi:hypothetical protein
MISDERKQALIEGAFYQAESLNDLRWLNSQFALVLNALPLKAQFQLSGVLERRVSEVEGVTREQDRTEMANGQGHDEASSPAGDSGEVLRTVFARGESPAPAELSGSDGSPGAAEGRAE